MTCLGLLVLDEILDLAGPADDDGLESLDQVLVLDGGIHIRQVFVWDVEVRLALSVVARLGDVGHEGVQVGHEFLLHAFWPVVLSQKLWSVFLVHDLEQIIKRVAIQEARDHL